MVKVNKRLTKINFKKGINKINKYIVIHYVGAEGDALANCKYFEKIYRGASAQYFVGFAGDIWQCVEDFDIAWHCGAIKYKHKYCRNTNSIGIEMCCRKNSKGQWYFEEATVLATIELVRELMAKYNIPVENVIRHYDVTGKRCPEPYVRDAAAWNNFKAKLGAKPEPAPSTAAFKVRVTADALNIRSSAEMGNNIVGCIRDKGVYTIVEVKGIWGKLKSGAGWISLNYTKRI